MTKKVSLVILFLSINYFLFSQPKTSFVLKGKVVEKESSKPLANANVSINNVFVNTVSNANGEFTIGKLKKGNKTIVVNYLGYKPFEKEIFIGKDTSIEVALEKTFIMLDEAKIVAVKANSNSPTSFTNITKEEIEKQNLGQDFPILLNNTPSVVVTSDAGAGVGYTGYRIRGSDFTRINVTVNGIPVNDAESQGTYWVDFPDLASSMDNVQIQRGVGTSTNGAGSFGGSLNIQTTKLNEKAYANISSSAGSFNTFKNTVGFGTGLLSNKFAFDGRLSKITSDGYIDRAFSDMKSYYLSGAYVGKNNMLKFITYSGKEKTYQSWYGVPQDSLKTNRTYNVYSYPNQTDNYQQDNYQLLYSQNINKYFTLNSALHYTYGRGYYEEYQSTSDVYHITDLNFYNLGYMQLKDTTITNSNIIRQRWLDNDFYGVTYALDYDSKNEIKSTIGGAYNEYIGRHYGQVMWAQYAGNNLPDKKYYNNIGTKKDFNIFWKTNYQLNNQINIFTDIQYRNIFFKIKGREQYYYGFITKDETYNLNFSNPKVGMMYNFTPNKILYMSYAVGNKEPNRNDYYMAKPNNLPKAEKLQNIEAGYKHNSSNYAFNVNYFYMYYTNQLVLSGKLNDVGEAERINISQSYRQGIELSGKYRIIKNLELNANATLSENKIYNFKEYVFYYDSYGTVLNTDTISHNKTDISFSPNIVAYGSLDYEPIKNLKLSFVTKYVGKQYLDNTQNENRKLKEYTVSDAKLSYTVKSKFVKEINFSLLVNNVFNYMYESNGWSSHYFMEGNFVNDNYYYPQAGTNFLAGVKINFY